jgi:hypothetical protein
MLDSITSRGEGVAKVRLSPLHFTSTQPKPPVVTPPAEPSDVFTRELEQLKRDVEEIAQLGLFNRCYISGEPYIQIAYDELDEHYLAGKCGTYSPKLQEKLVDRGYKIQRSTSAHPIAHLPDDRGSFHVYLVTRIQGQEILIDPTAGQFIKGQNRIFVGTRAELEALVLNPQTEIINTSPRLTRQEAFWSHWGSESKSLERDAI